MDWTTVNTIYLIENTLSKDDVIKYLHREKGMAVSSQTLDCYMSNYQRFPRFINVYNSETMRREQRWLKADIQEWEPPKAKRYRLRMEEITRQLAMPQSYLSRAHY